MNKPKILDKILKCLRLSKSSEANEAAAALRQAQKLMATHGITEDDLKVAGYSDEAVDVPIQKNKKMPLVLTLLVNIISGAFGVRPVIEDRIGISDVSYRVRYFGPTGRVQLAAYAHQVVYRAIESAWRQYLKENPHLRGQRGARSSFQVGWLNAVAQKVEDIGFPPEEVEATKSLMTTRYGKDLAKAKTNNEGVYSRIAGQGADAAKDFNINRPMGTERVRLEKLK